jgi:uncharacterized protein YbjT (DUF2867 family)
MLELIALTGATGQLGGRVARQLAEAGHRLRLVVRDPDRAPHLSGVEVAQAEYSDEKAMRTALEGTDTLFFVSGREAEDRLEQHRRVVEAAAAAKVGRIVYTSFLAAAPDSTFTLGRQHYHTEQFIRESGARFVFLRDSLYTDIVPYLVAEGGVIRGPAGTGKVAMVTRDDVAASAAVVITDPSYDGKTFDMTGPEATTLAEIAETLMRFVGSPISYYPETMDEAWASRAVYGAPDWEVEGWISSYAAIASGDLDVVSDTIRTLTGHEAQSLDQFLTRHPESYQHLIR